MTNLVDVEILKGVTDIRVHPDDRAAFTQVAKAVYAILEGPVLQVDEDGNPHWKGGDAPGPGMYRAVPVWNLPGLEPDRILRPGWVEPESWKKDRELIWARLQKHWDWDTTEVDGRLVPVPRPGAFQCLCGGDSWLVRWWTFFDYRLVSGDDQKHKFRYRVDVSLKCVTPADVDAEGGCGFVAPPWGLPIPSEVWEERGFRVGNIQNNR